MEVKIGLEIKKVAKRKRIGATELASMLSMTAPNIHKIWAKKTIDTQLLFRISKALDYNFFKLYGDNFKGKFIVGLEAAMHPGDSTKDEEIEDELTIAKQDNERLKKEIATLEKLMQAKDEILDLLREENKRLKTESKVK